MPHFPLRSVEGNWWHLIRKKRLQKESVWSRMKIGNIKMEMFYLLKKLNQACKRNDIPWRKVGSLYFLDDHEELQQSVCDDAMSNDIDEFDDNECVECLELYSQAQSGNDWIQCVAFRRWKFACTLWGDRVKCCGCRWKYLCKKAWWKKFSVHYFHVCKINQ